MDYIIRPARPDEIEEIAKIEAECFPPAEAASFAEFADRYRAFPENFLVAQGDGQLLGFINGGTTDQPHLPDEFYHNTALHNPAGAYQTVFGLDVLPAFRRSGIAADLLGHLTAQARSQNKKGVILTCKEHLIPFYEKQGFVNYGASDSNHGGASWYDMRCIFEKEERMSNIIEITDFSAPELDIYARLTEAQLLHYHEPQNGLFIAESPIVVERALDAGYLPLSLLAERRHIDGQARSVIARCREIPVYTADFEVLKQLTGFPMTRGLLCAMHRPALPSLQDVCANARRIAVLEDVMNPTNVGAIFRSAAALNMDAILLTPACSDPLYRRAIRVSMGTVFQLPWTYLGQDGIQWPKPGIQFLRDMGFQTVAMALRDDSVSIDDPRLTAAEKLAVVLGTEGDGLAADTIADCDYTVRIPMARGVDSLNVAAASAVAFWQLGKR